MNLKMHGWKYARFIQHLEGLLEAAEAKCPKEVLGSVGSWSCSLSYLSFAKAFFVVYLVYFCNFILFGILCVMWVFCVCVCDALQELEPASKSTSAVPQEGD